jgi:hypothetical protein
MELQIIMLAVAVVLRNQALLQLADKVEVVIPMLLELLILVEAEVVGATRLAVQALMVGQALSLSAT